MSSNSYSGKFIEKLISDLEKLEKIYCRRITRGKKGNAVFLRGRGDPVIIAVNLPYEVAEEFSDFAILQVIKRDSKYILARVVAYSVKYESDYEREVVYRDDLVEITADYEVTKVRLKLYDIAKREFEGIVKKELVVWNPYTVKLSDRAVNVLKDMVYNGVNEKKIGNVTFKITECRFGFDKANVVYDIVLPDRRVITRNVLEFKVDYSRLLTEDIKVIAEDLVKLFNEYEQLFELSLRKEGEAYECIYEWKVKCRNCNSEFTFRGKALSEMLPVKCPKCGVDKVTREKYYIVYHDGYRLSEETVEVTTVTLPWYDVVKEEFKEKVVVSTRALSELKDVEAKMGNVLELMKKVCERAGIRLIGHEEWSDSETFIFTDFTGKSRVTFCQGACFLRGSLLFGYISSLLREKFNDFIYLLVEKVLR